MGDVARDASWRRMRILNRRQQISCLFIDRHDNYDTSDQSLTHSTVHWLDRRQRRTIGDITSCWTESGALLRRDGVDPDEFPDVAITSRVWLPTRPNDFDEDGECTITWASWLAEQEDSEDGDNRDGDSGEG